MKKIILILLLSTLLILNAQSFELPDASGSYVMNGVSTSNVLKKGNLIFVATEKGLQHTDSELITWMNIDLDLKNSRIIKMILDSEGDIWLSLGRDTTIAGEDLIKGSGLYYVNTSDLSSRYFKQALDPQINFDESIIKVPVTTTVNNLTYDIAETIDSISGNRYIWIASFAGSLRYLDADNPDDGWTLITPNKSLLDVAQNNATGYAQRVFSLASEDNHLWVGTANGIYYSNDHGDNFEHVRFLGPQSSSISANFITELSISEGNLFANSRIVNNGEYNALNIAEIDYSNAFTDWTWSKQFNENWVRRITTYDNLWLAGTNTGFFISDDAGQSWDAFAYFYGQNIDSDIDANRINDILIDTLNGDDWYIATSAGFVVTNTNGNNYTIYKSRNTLPELKKSDNSLVYPSPYSPKHSDALINITFTMKLSGIAEVEIYNFAMEQVHKFKATKTKSIAANFTWNGKNKQGQILPNGVYFVMIKANDDIYWNKVVILN